MSKKETSYVYVITRKDLPYPHNAVQACHAAIEAAAQFYNPSQDEHPHLVLCEVQDENRLHKAALDLQAKGVQVLTWKEPDRNHELTAIATEPLKGSKRLAVKRFQVIKPFKESLL